MRKELIEALSIITPEEQAILDGMDKIDRSLYTENTDFIVDQQKMLEKGNLIQIRTHTRFTPFPEHSHNYVEMVYMCQGKTRHIVDGTPVTLREGELLIMNQHARQSIEAAGKEDIAINFIILPDFFDETLRMLGHEDSALRDFLVSCLEDGDTPMSYLHYQISDNIPVQNLVENLVYYLLQKEDTDKNIEITMGLLFLQLLKHTDAIHTDRASYRKKLVLDALAYIDVHYKNGRLGEFAKAHHYEISSLSKLIRKMTGFTWQELLQQKRMESACALLDTTELSVADVALAVGYENISFFHRLFKKYYGLSPRHYRVKYAR